MGTQGRHEMSTIEKVIQCPICGKEWEWIDEHSFRRCECGNLYVIGFEREVTDLECEDLTQDA